MAHLVWFKRDLRLYDHAPLHQAALAATQAGDKLVCLYIVEPEYWRLPDTSGRQYRFLCESLEDLAGALAELGQRLVVRVGAAVPVLMTVAAEAGIHTIWSHQETGNGWTYARDRAVGAWARASGIAWHEIAGNGVIRGRHDRDHWAAHWDSFMARPVPRLPALPQASALAGGAPPRVEALGLAAEGGWIRGGRRSAIDNLDDFLRRRGHDYVRGMSSPGRAERVCSLHSAALSLGCVSVRETWQAMEKRRREAAPGSGWRRAMTSFNSRLHWHCHFMQKLEDQPDLEFVELHPAYRGLRAPDPAALAAWRDGVTGYPMVDACMRYLAATGWLNFRMRAMIVSFASYHLWLPWQETAPILARRFADYEPGIHYSQMQMQSGTTGTNVLRIYNPIKQGQDHDPAGLFVRRWVPEIAHLPEPLLHTPWLAESPPAGYPTPIVDEAAARRLASARLYAIRRTPEHMPVAQRIVEKHGSRNRLGPGTRAERRAARQGDLFA